MENKPIRVLQMIGSLYPGGSQTMIMNIYKNIDRNKIQFDFIVDHPEYDFYKSTIEELGGKIYIMPSFKGYNFLEIIKSWNDFFDNHPEYKVLHSHSRSYASIYLPIAKKHGLKTIIHSHSISNGENIKSVIKYIFQLPLRFQADYYFGCSKEAGLWLFGNKIVNSNKFHVLNNAVDISKFEYDSRIRDKYRRKFNVENKIVYIQVGNFVPEKNHIFSVDLINKLKDYNDDIRLFIVGDGDQRKNIENEIKKYNLEKYVELLGFRNDVNNLLQMADYYLMPSTFEGLSLAAIEAQASGINCVFSDKIDISTKVSSVCEFVELDINKWYDITINSKIERKNTKEEIVKSGFDIKTTSKWIQDFYLRCTYEYK